jgi:hypothetical protein
MSFSPSSGSSSISTGNDVALNAVTDNDVLTYDGSVQKWRNKPVAAGTVADGSVTTAKLQDGSVTNAKVTAVDASKITTGTLDTNRLPSLSSTYAPASATATAISSLQQNTPVHFATLSDAQTAGANGQLVVNQLVVVG